MRALIIASGTFSRPETLRACATRGTLVIAADGGARHCVASGVPPHLVIGDLDSLSPELAGQLTEQGVEFLRFSARKDESDLELAFREATARGAGELLVFGAFGGREDHALANLMLAVSPTFERTRTTFFGLNMEAHALHKEREVHLVGAAGDTVSLLPLGGTARGVSTTGLEYPLQDEDLPAGSPRGLSNQLRGTSARIRLQAGHLLVFHYDQERDGKKAESLNPLETC